MLRPGLLSFAAGIVAGACTAISTAPTPAQPYKPVAGWDAVRTGSTCWDTDKPIPEEFVGMKLFAADAVSRRFILKSGDRAVLIGEVAPGLSCVLGEGGEA